MFTALSSWSFGSFTLIYVLFISALMAAKLLLLLLFIFLFFSTLFWLILCQWCLHVEGPMPPAMQSNDWAFA
jgi:hypothetical protein